MSTLSFFSTGNYTVPGNTSWYLSDLGEFRGKQELYTRQSPQRLKTLREHAIRFATETVVFPGYCSSCSASSLVMRSAVTSAVG